MQGIIERSDLDPNYGRHYRELYEKHWWWRAREEILIDEFHRLLHRSSPLSILDVGCGDGLFFNRLRQFGEVEGVEPAAALVDPLGPDRGRITVAPFDAKFNSGKKYNLILMLDVLEHLDVPEEALRQALSLLEPQGMIVVTVPAFRLLWTNHDQLNEHRTRFTKDSFRRVAASAGMKIIQARYFFTWLFFAKLGARLMETILPEKPKIPTIPWVGLNQFLFRLSRAEEKIIRRVPIPIGSSLFVVGTSSPKEEET